MFIGAESLAKWIKAPPSIDGGTGTGSGGGGSGGSGGTGCFQSHRPLHRSVNNQSRRGGIRHGSSVRSDPEGSLKGSWEGSCQRQFQKTKVR